MNQHAGGKWLIHGTKRRKDNQLQSLEHLWVRYVLWNFKGNLVQRWKFTNYQI